MRARRIPSAFIALLAALFFAPLAKADPVENAVIDIRAKYNKIEGAKLPSKSINWEPGDDPAWGKMTKYYSDGNLVKVYFNFGEGDHGGGDEYYYYWNGEFIFAFANQSYWKFTGRTKADGQEETADVNIEQRLYFANGQLIRHLYREASSTNPQLLKQIMAATENAHQNDPEFASQVQRRAILAASASSPGDIENIIYGE